jgi:hypothetical protein
MGKVSGGFSLGAVVAADLILLNHNVIMTVKSL